MGAERPRSRRPCRITNLPIRNKKSPVLDAIAPRRLARGGRRELIDRNAQGRELLRVHRLTEQADFSVADHPLRESADDAFEIAKKMGHLPGERRNAEIADC